MVKEKIIGLILCCLFTFSINAQRGHHHGQPMIMGITKDVKAALSLTKNQVTQLRELKQNNGQNIYTIKTNDALTKEEKRQQFHALRRTTKARLAEILTEEQMSQWKTLHQKERAEQKQLHHETNHHGMYTAIQAYRNENIRPAVLEQRQKLDTHISSEDQVELISIRASLAEARAERQAYRAEKKKNGKPHGHCLHRKHRQSLAERFPQEYATLTTMIQRYDNHITRLREELKPQRQEWKTEQREIRQEYRPEGLGKCKRHLSEEAKARRLERSKIRFLLLDVATDTEQQTNITAASLYPNPTVDATALTIELKENAVVSIDLRDEKGHLLRNIARTQMNVGKNQYAIDLSHINNGTYYITVRSGQREAPQTLKLIVIK